MPPQPKNHVESQREIQCKLGRNLLRIQQLEIMIKSMVASSVIESNTADLQGSLDKRKQNVAKKTLGQVVGDLTTDFLSQPASDEVQQQNHSEDTTNIQIRTSIRIELPPEDHQRTKQSLANLVELRNKLVHHFIEIHDISTESGCAKAETYLDDCFRLINEQFEELGRIAQHQKEALKKWAIIMQSDRSRDFLKQP